MQPKTVESKAEDEKVDENAKGVKPTTKVKVRAKTSKKSTPKKTKSKKKKLGKAPKTSCVVEVEVEGRGISGGVRVSCVNEWA